MRCMPRVQGHSLVMTEGGSDVVFVLGGVAAVFVVSLLFGAITGRIRMRSCCAVADPAKDLRMRAAFEDEDARS